MASMNCPITSGTLCIRLISSWALTNSRLRLLLAGQNDSSPERRLGILPLLIFDVFLLQVYISGGLSASTA